MKEKIKNKIRCLDTIKKISEINDAEIAHGLADDLLCEILRKEGYGELVDLYEEIEKWYS